MRGVQWEALARYILYGGGVGITGLNVHKHALYKDGGMYVHTVKYSHTNPCMDFNCGKVQPDAILR